MEELREYAVNLGHTLTDSVNIPRRQRMVNGFLNEEIKNRDGRMAKAERLFNKVLDKITFRDKNDPRTGVNENPYVKWWAYALEREGNFERQLKEARETKEKLDSILRDKFGSGEVYANEKLFMKYFMEIQDLVKLFEDKVNTELKTPVMQLRIDAAATAIQ